MGFSLTNHLFWGTPIYGNPHIHIQCISFTDHLKIPPVLCALLPRQRPCRVGGPPGLITSFRHLDIPQLLPQSTSVFCTQLSWRNQWHWIVLDNPEGTIHNPAQPLGNPLGMQEIMASFTSWKHRCTKPYVLWGETEKRHMVISGDVPSFSMMI